MGAGFTKESNSGDSSSGPSSSSSTPNLGDIPESCISYIFLYLDPLEICKLARLNRDFHAASLSDFVWESKLPSNYKFLVQTLLHQSNYCNIICSKKEIYARLCQPNPFDDFTKEVWLDKISGKVLVAISCKALKITGIDDRRYWNFIATQESRFHSVAYLKQIWWVEILGELVDFEFPAGSYSVYFRLQLGKPSRKSYGRRSVADQVEQVHGWNIKPVRFLLSTSNGQHALSECYLHELGNWVHFHVGDFQVENPNWPITVKFSMIQIDCTHTKGGLCVDSVLISPTKI